GLDSGHNRKVNLIMAYAGRRKQPLPPHNDHEGHHGGIGSGGALMTQTLAPLTAHVNLFRGSYDPHPTAIWTLEAAIRAIRTGTWQNQMSKLRHTLATQGKGLYDHDKKRLDAFS